MEYRKDFRRDLSQHQFPVYTFEFHDLDQQQMHILGVFTQFFDDESGGIREECFNRLPFCRQNDRQDFPVWMLVHDDRCKDILLARKVVVNTSERQVGAFSDLPHRGGVVALFHK